MGEGYEADCEDLPVEVVAVCAEYISECGLDEGEGEGVWLRIFIEASKTNPSEVA